jgi:anthranilate 3-monooxygenase (FAD)/4-hydroxyphenylacetate 3-monooxygenase
MAARSGKEYITSLKGRSPDVYLDGRRVASVVDEPIFAGPAQSVADQYDMQLQPAYKDIMTYTSPLTGEPVSTSFLIPESKEELIKRRQHFKLRADQTFGMMGRGPDFMNSLITTYSLGASSFAAIKPEFADNIRSFYERAREQDLFMTHALVNPQIDRSKTSANQKDPYLHLGKVRETKDGIIVRGAKMLATMAPLTDEIVVFPFGGIAPGDENYALAFTLPTDAKGLRWICRETVAAGPRTLTDHPLSSRFEEMDCIAIFNDVLVPWDRVWADGSGPSRDILNKMPPASGAGTLVQMNTRLLSSMETMCATAVRLADVVAIDGFLHVQEKLGEMLLNLENIRAVFYGAEAMASQAPDGTWNVYPRGLAYFQCLQGSIYARYVEIVRTLAAGGFFYAPTEADFENPELREDISKYAQGRPGVSARERVSVFKLAWDLVGDGFGSRVAQYTRYYGGDPVRNVAGFFVGYPKDELGRLVDRVLAGRSAAFEVPVSPEHPELPPPPADGPDPATALTGTYPASSHPGRG